MIRVSNQPISSGYVKIIDDNMTYRTVVIPALEYKGSTYTYILNVQPLDGYANIYVRNPDGSLPNDGNLISMVLICRKI